MIETIVNARGFGQVLSRRDAVLAVLFYGVRDPNSHKIKSIFEKFAAAEGCAVSCAAMEYDDWSRVVDAYRITAMPTILAFSYGELKDRILGARTRRELVAYFAEYVAPSLNSSA